MVSATTPHWRRRHRDCVKEVRPPSLTFCRSVSVRSLEIFRDERRSDLSGGELGKDKRCKDLKSLKMFPVQDNGETEAMTHGPPLGPGFRDGWEDGWEDGRGGERVVPRGDPSGPLRTVEPRRRVSPGGVDG